MEENFKKIVEKSMIQTDSDFTSKVMETIHSEEKVLSNLLTTKANLATSVDFTAQLMTQLEGKSPATPYSPVISKIGWIGIAATFVGIICVTLFLGTNDIYDAPFASNFDQLKRSIDSITTIGIEFQYLMIGILVLSIGLVIEQNLGRRMSRK